MLMLMLMRMVIRARIYRLFIDNWLLPMVANKL